MGRVVKLGIVGTGRIGQTHINNINKLVEGAEVIAAADIFIDKSREAVEALGVKYTYEDYRDLIANPEVEAVIVASSTDTHAEISIAAARAGKAVFCEKPIDKDLDKIKEVLDVVKETGVKFQTGFNRRFDHNFRRVRDMVDSGRIGDPHIVRVTSRDPAPPPVEYVKVSGGIYFDMMIHDFDMVRFLSGSEVTEVYATGTVLIDPAIGEAGDVDTALVILKFANGAIGTIDNSRQAVYGYDQRVEVLGSKGLAKCENDKPSTVEVFTVDEPTSDKIPYFFLDRYTGAFVDQFTSFVKAIVEDTPTAVNEMDGYRAVQIAYAATQSLKEGRPVKVEI
ncbi:MAG: inositol 2-dehydrogenase [Fastidiosipilaceae bacterium]|jgi:myo-inositol 2-dehydrogenase/D-chiro-inositol 1-dehydrogenase